MSMISGYRFHHPDPLDLNAAPGRWIRKPQATTPLPPVKPERVTIELGALAAEAAEELQKLIAAGRVSFPPCETLEAKAGACGTTTPNDETNATSSILESSTGKLGDTPGG